MPMFFDAIARRPFRTPGIGTATMRNHISIEPITPRIGATVAGADLATPLAPQELAVLRGAFIKHQVLFFGNQHLDPAAFRRFAQYFGRPEWLGSEGLPDYPDVRPVKSGRSSDPPAGNQWHADSSYNAKPPVATLLYFENLPDVAGGELSFSSMYAAYDALSEGTERLFVEDRRRRSAQPVVNDAPDRVRAYIDDRDRPFADHTFFEGLEQFEHGPLNDPSIA